MLQKHKKQWRLNQFLTQLCLVRFPTSIMFYSSSDMFCVLLQHFSFLKLQCFELSGSPWKCLFGFFSSVFSRTRSSFVFDKNYKNMQKKPKQTIRTHNKVFVCGEEVSLLVAACLICQSNSEKWIEPFPSCIALQWLCGWMQCSLSSWMA